MPTSQVWGNTVGSGSNARVYLTYDRIDRDSVNGRLVNPKIHWAMNSGWSDSNNYIDSGGSAINGARVHSGLLNSSRSWNVSAKAVPLAYGTTTNYTFTVTVYGVAYFRGDSNTSTFTWTIAFPERPYSLPKPATNLTSVYQDLNKAYLSWTPNYTSASGATPWSQQYIDRSEGTNWNNAVNVSGELSRSPTNWTDTSLQPNKRYMYRHIARNPSGFSPYTYAPNPVYTKPAAPSNPYAQKALDGSILVMWSNEAPWANSFEVSDSADGATWTVLDTSSVSEYTHSAPNQSVTHCYRIRAKTPDGKWSDYSPASNVIQLLAPPNKPSWVFTDPAFDATTAITTPWLHNPVDTTAQTAYEVQWRSSADNGATWSGYTTTGKITSTTRSRTWPVNTFPQDQLIERQVRTWGQHATASPWSNAAQFRTSAKPTVGINSPTVGQVLQGKTAKVVWTYSDAEGSAQSSYRVFLYSAGGAETLGSWIRSGSASEFTLPYELEDDTSYQIGVQVRDGAGLWSSTAAASFSVDYLPPPVPLVVTEWDTTRAAGVLIISNPDPTGGAPAAVSNNVYRDGLLIATDLPINTTYVDALPKTSGTSYVVEAVSALPSFSKAPSVALPHNEEVYRRFWLNAGPGWGTVASFYGNVKRRRSTGIAKTVEHYSGRELPVETFGEAVTDALSFSATLYDLEDSPEDFHAISKIKSTVCLREPKGRWFVSVSPVDASSDNHLTSEISVEFKRVDFEEGVS